MQNIGNSKFAINLWFHAIKICLIYSNCVINPHKNYKLTKTPTSLTDTTNSKLSPKNTDNKDNSSDDKRLLTL